MPRSRAMRILGHPATWVLLVALAFALPLSRSLRHHAPEPIAQLPAFSFFDQDAKPFDLARLKGHPTVVNFIFTTCPSVCPLLSQKMSGLQEKTRELANARLVSFTVDPTNDTPAVLKAYGAKFHQDPARWTFVTGDPTAIAKTVEEGFKIALQREKKANADDFDIVHGEQFVLVDANGAIRGYYHADEAGLSALVADLSALEDGR